jgi:Nucleotidyl transferase AbiEii toxin, Type IV TA system
MASRRHSPAVRPPTIGAGVVSAAQDITVTVGWIARHTPKGAGAGGREAAILDIAQDLLLRDLHDSGALDALVFKGGTALRKLYAGNQGRFSLDLDFSLAVPADPRPWSSTW